MATKEMVRSYLDHIVAGEWEEAMGHWADDIVGHVSGTNPTSGTYIGKEAFAGYLTTAVGLIDTMQVMEHDVLVSDDHVVVLSTLHADRGENHMASNRVVVYHTENEKITELWIIEEDQKAVDEFLA